MDERARIKSLLPAPSACMIIFPFHEVFLSSTYKRLSAIIGWGLFVCRKGGGLL
nr:MAG TPA: hypothetical protein [Caudoviricetes sp.]